MDMKKGVAEFLYSQNGVFQGCGEVGRPNMEIGCKYSPSNQLQMTCWLPTTPDCSPHPLSF